MKRIVLMVALALFVQVAQAHKGGHAPKLDQDEKTWTFQDKTVAAMGSFMLSKDGQVLIEQGHRVVSITITDLSEADQLYVQSKEVEIGALNRKHEQVVSVDEKNKLIDGLVNDESNIGIILAVLAVIALLLLFYVFSRVSKKQIGLGAFLLAMMTLASCGSDDDVSSVDVDVTTSDEATAYDVVFMESSFSHFDNVEYSSDDDYFYVESNGLPDHQMMVGITAWIAQVPVPRDFTGDNAWSIPRNPEYATENVSISDDLQRGAIAIASNGIPIFNPYNASGLISADIGELDEYGGHSGRGDDYHYHVPPTHLSSSTGTDPIAFLFDGFPLYGTTEPDGSDLEALDEFGGHEDDEGLYHYHTLSVAPYMTPKLKGVVVLEGNSPETQISPQPVASAFRQDLYRINSDNLLITDLQLNDSYDGYSLFYTSNDIDGKVEYSWTDSEMTFIFTDDVTQSSSTTEVFNVTGIPEVHVGAYGGSSFTVTSEAISGGVLSDDFTCEEKVNDVEASIPITWSNIPDGTGSIAVTMTHYPNTNDSSNPNSYLLLWDIDPSVTSIAHGAADDGPFFIGQNKDGTAISYTSPCSPSTGSHEYTITVYALSETPSSLPSESSLSVDYDVLVSAIETVTILGTAELIFNDIIE